MKHHRVWKRLAAGLLAGVLLATATGCGGGGTTPGGNSENGGGKDTLTVAYRSEATNLDPHNNQSLTAFSVEMLIYDRLVERDADGNIVPSLATEWEELDETTIRFHLRDDVYFHNGEKLTAEDVKYTIERAEVMPGSRSFMSSFDGEGTTVVDETTIDIKLHEPFAPIYNFLASARGDIVCKSEVEKVGSDVYGRAPVGSGPLKFENWVAGDSITLVRNDEYWGTKAAYSKFVARFIVEDSSRAIELETGGVDVVLNLAGSDMDRLADDPNVTIYNEPGYSVMWLLMNQAYKKEFEDIRVRQAMFEALDIEAIVDTVYGNTATVADSIYSPKIGSYTSVGKPNYNPEHAKQLLKEAGYDTNMVLELTTTDNNQQIMICEIVKNMWGEVGINVEVTIQDLATSVEKSESGKGSIGVSAPSASSGDPDHALYEWKNDNYGLRATDRMKELIELGAKTYDAAQRNEYYKELQQLCWEHHAVIPLAFPNVIYGTRSNIQNMDVNPGNVPNFARVTFSN